MADVKPARRFFPTARRAALILLLIVPGTVCFLICLYYALKDWTALQNAYTNFEHIAATTDNQSRLFVADAKQNIHRINLFADGVWALLGAIVAAIGLHGVCTLPQTRYHDA